MKRKISLQMQISSDGFAARMDGALDWVNFNWSEDLLNYVGGITEPINTILLGANLAQGFIPHWQEALKAKDKSADKFVNTPKIVFSKSLPENSAWKHTYITSKEPKEIIEDISNELQGEIMLYGGVSLANNFIEQSLLDELYLFDNQINIKDGKQLLSTVISNPDYALVQERRFECGIVLKRFLKR